MSATTPSAPGTTTDDKKAPLVDAAPQDASEANQDNAPAPETVIADPPSHETKEHPREHSKSTDESLTPKQKGQFAKQEIQEARRQSKILKDEAKEQKQALSTAERELSGLQKVHVVAVKNEGKANAKHTKVLREFQKIEAVFLATRTKFEAAQARLQSEDETVEIVRNHAKEATETLQVKVKEVDGLRTKWTSDEKERTVKLNELAAKGAGNGNGCIIC